MTERRRPAVFVKVTAQTLDKVLPFASEHGLDLEIVDLIHPDTFWRRLDELQETYAQALAGFEGVLSLHGPFIDLYLHSVDPKVAAIARESIERTLSLCDALAIDYAIFHGNFLPLIPEASYRRHWVDVHAAFWSRAVAAHECAVVLENLWDREPQVFRALFDKVSASGLGMCLDVGHCAVYSSVALADWLELLGRRILLLHLNDNDGERDLELVPGRGVTEWAALTELVKRHCDSPHVSLELATLGEVQEALDYMRVNAVYPFG